MVLPVILPVMLRNDPDRVLECVCRAAAEGRWSLALAEAALNVVDLNGKVLEMEALPPLRECVGSEPALFLIECADGAS